MVALRLLREFWLPLGLVVLAGALAALFFALLPDSSVSWNDKGNMGQFFKGLVTCITMLVFFFAVWMQVRAIPAQQRELEQTHRDMVRQTEYLRQQWELQGEQLNQLKIQEVLANIRVLADNIAEVPAEAPGSAPAGAVQESWRSQTTTELTQASLMLLRRHSLGALQSLCHSGRPILEIFALETIAAIKSSLRGAQLRGANLEGILLESAFLIESDLREANLRNARLGGSNLLGADLRGATLDGADLAGAHLIQANLERANLLGANLREVNLLGANLDQAALAGADVARASVERRWQSMLQTGGAKNVDQVHWSG